MKSHILCRFSETVPKQLQPCTFYDFASQVSYSDDKYLKKVIDGFASILNDKTYETATIETSDKDNYSEAAFGTIMTETVENSDKDNFHLCGSTIETRGVETSDIDNVYKMCSTITTFTTENTDKDN